MKACSMDRMGFGRAVTACQCSTYVPLHAIQVFIRLLSVPFLFDCVVARLNAVPSNCVARTVWAARVTRATFSTTGFSTSPEQKTTKYDRLQWMFVVYLNA